MMKTKFTYTEEDVIEAHRAWREHLASWETRARPSFYVIGGSLIALLGGALLFFHDGIIIGIGCVVYGIFLALWYGLLPSYRARRAFRRWNGGECEVAMSISEEALHFSYIHVEATLEWGGFSRYLETQNLFVLWVRSHNFYILPKRAFAEDDLSGLRHLFQQKIRARNPAPTAPVPDRP